MALEAYSKGQSHVGYGVAREGCTVFLCFKRISAAYLVFLPLLQSTHFQLGYLSYGIKYQFLEYGITDKVNGTSTSVFLVLRTTVKLFAVPRVCLRLTT